MELFDVAQHGVFSAADSDGLGIGPARRRAMCRQGTIRRLIRGWYAAPAPDGSLPWTVGTSWERAGALHRLTTIALLRSFEGRVAASHYSAEILHDIPTWRADLSTVQLTRLEDDHSRHRAGAVIHPMTDGMTTTTADGLLTVPVAQAVVGTGLLGSGSPDPGILAMDALIGADHALRHDLATDAEIAEELRRHARHPGIVTAKAFLGHRDGRHESPGETRTAHALRGLGYAFTPQVEVVIGGHSRLLDFLLDDHPAAVEFDGVLKYKGDAVEASRVVHAEKLRESEIRDAIGCEFVRVEWAGLDRPRLLGQEIEEAIGRASRARRAA